MNVKFLDHTGLRTAAVAAKMCIGKEMDGWDMNAGDIAPFLHTIIKRGHESVLEHVVYVYQVKGISRACLQQVARHRHLSLSVKSTRWALKKHGEYFVPDEFDSEDKEAYKKSVSRTLKEVEVIREKYGNDVAKYLLPECLQTDMILTVNLRELRLIYKLRTAPNAMREFRQLAQAMVACLPEDEQGLVRA